MKHHKHETPKPCLRVALASIGALSGWGGGTDHEADALNPKLTGSQ